MRLRLTALAGLPAVLVVLSIFMLLFGTMLKKVHVDFGSLDRAVDSQWPQQVAGNGTTFGGGVTAMNVAGIPAAYVPMIKDAVGRYGCPAIPAPIVAAQLQAESGFDPKAVSPAGAQGIAQFMPGTWPGYAVDANNDGSASPWDPADAIAAQVKYDCALVPASPRPVAAQIPGICPDAASWATCVALASYNAGSINSDGTIPVNGQTEAYVPKIMAAAKQFGLGISAAGDVTGGSIDPKIATVVNFVEAQVGKPYNNYPGTGPDSFDCSGLVQTAYKLVGIDLPRVTYDQYKIAQIPLNSPLQPGDLLFITGADPNAQGEPGHVGMYVGNGRIVQAEGHATGINNVSVDYYGPPRYITRPILLAGGH